MIAKESMLEDRFSDDVLEAIKLLNAEPKWNSKKHNFKTKLIELLKSEGYIDFTVTNVKQYRISRVGQSYLYDVPLNRRGHLSVFRGKRVRIVCTGSGRHSFRKFMVNAIPDDGAGHSGGDFNDPLYKISEEQMEAISEKMLGRGLVRCCVPEDNSEFTRYRLEKQKQQKGKV